MHNTERLANWAKGKVWGYFINPVTKETTKPFEIHNIISYTGADIMARLVGGDDILLPAVRGFHLRYQSCARHHRAYHVAYTDLD